MKLWLLPVHIETSNTYYAKLAAAKALGKAEQDKKNTALVGSLMRENTKIKYGRKVKGIL